MPCSSHLINGTYTADFRAIGFKVQDVRVIWEECEEFFTKKLIRRVSGVLQGAVRLYLDRRRNRTKSKRTIRFHESFRSTACSRSVSGRIPVKPWFRVVIKITDPHDSNDQSHFVCQ